MWMIIIAKILFPQVYATLEYYCYPVWFTSYQRLFNYLAFQLFDYERTWWRLFQKRVMRTKFDIYIFVPLDF